MGQLRRLINILVLTAALNSPIICGYFRVEAFKQILIYCVSLICILLINIFPCRVKNDVFRLRSIMKGRELLLMFSVTFLALVIANGVAGVIFVPANISWWYFGINMAVGVMGSLILLVNGLSRVFLTSQQLGIRWRLLILFFWWVPVVNFILLNKVCRLVRREYEVETGKNQLNNIRSIGSICATKYPLLLVHGVFFRDFRYFSYWGRIPKELKKNGAVFYLGQQQSAASVKDTAAELATRIKEIVEETGCDKINIIAHSKGGLDARYAISCLGMDQFVASLTTISTPHHGCLFADHLLEKTSEKFVNRIAKSYNAALRKLGDQNPDFIAAVTDLTAENCRQINEEAPDKDTVYYKSYGSKLNTWMGGRFPLNLSNILVQPFDGENDGLVSVSSAEWGAQYTVLSPTGKRGISHGDVIDLNRENIDDFDVRELYVGIVKDLKALGF